jgi:hypothetical protein
MLTFFQKALILRLQKAGGGYARFANNVEQQDWCSAKQQKAMENMDNSLAKEGPDIDHQGGYSGLDSVYEGMATGAFDWDW